MLRQRCFHVVIDAISYLVQPARRAMMGVGIEQRVGTQAHTLATSQDPSLVYAA